MRLQVGLEVGFSLGAELFSLVGWVEVNIWALKYTGLSNHIGLNLQAHHLSSKTSVYVTQNDEVLFDLKEDLLNIVSKNYFKDFMVRWLRSQAWLRCSSTKVLSWVRVLVEGGLKLSLVWMLVGGGLKLGWIRVLIERGFKLGSSACWRRSRAQLGQGARLRSSRARLGFDACWRRSQTLLS